MPIVVREFTWTQTATHVYLTVPLKGITKRRADVNVNDLYVKINFSPYIFELDLYEKVDGDEAVVTFGLDEVVFDLAKVESADWPQIKYTANSPADTRARREQADQQVRERADTRRAVREAQRREEERAQVQRQIDAERAERALAETRKKEHEDGAKADLGEWVQTISEAAEPKDGNWQTIESASSQEDYSSTEKVEKDQDIFSSEDVGSMDIKGSREEAEEEEELDDESGLDMAQIQARVKSSLAGHTRPPPRASGLDIQIKHTSRGFIPVKTARESEDLKWQTRIKDMQKRQPPPATVVDGDAIEDSSPAFLKDKGDAFYAQRNYEAAINAYTAALDIESSNFACMSNRAACQLQLNHFEECIADCQGALTLLDKEEEAFREKLIEDTVADVRRLKRSKLLVRIGTAQMRQDQGQQSLATYQKALELDPRNETLVKDVEMLQNLAGEMVQT
ncbi:hypothetical protein DFS34DRAFT_263615 [Phlyctochytrium arcticum]|nr:hypothetical protein DFS34DRAFT_263615 [Phlyctochytrium arcticum]